MSRAYDEGVRGKQRARARKRMSAEQQAKRAAIERGVADGRLTITYRCPVCQGSHARADHEDEQ